MLYIPSDMPSDYKSNGCGAEGHIDFIPDTIYGLCICEACKIHDYMYEVGINDKDKAFADDMFYHNLLFIITSYKKWYYPTFLAKIRAREYYLAVSNFGHSAFYANKEDKDGTSNNN